MERLNKRFRPEGYALHDDEARFAPDWAFESLQSGGRVSAGHSGEGIQNVNGNFHNGGDLLSKKGCIFRKQNVYADQRLRDIVQHFHNPDSVPNQSRKAATLESLEFDQIDAREMSIKRAHGQTCQWFLKTPQYLEWLKVDDRPDKCNLLWIKGKPGAGKSTMMKFLLSHARQTMNEETIISFFFTASGNNLEKSAIGLYRALLLQLIKAHPQLRHILKPVRAGHRWTIELLQWLLGDAFQLLSKISVFCFIDALDECDDSQARDIVNFLNDISLSPGVRLHICFASRYYPHISADRALELHLDLEQAHHQDIASYINSALRIGRGQLVEEISHDLQQMASGVFMWVVLVVDILNTRYDQGNKHRLRQELQRIPRGLHRLFHEVLTRDDKNMPELLLCIQWLLFAKYPPTPRELYYGILSGIEPESLSECHSDQISEDDIRKYILDKSKGLAESMKAEISTVQFINESFKDFLLKDKGLSTVWPDLGINLQGQSHDKLKQCCLEYMRIQSIAYLSLPSPLRKTPTTFLQQTRTQFPFLEYVTQNILYHADQAESNGVDQRDFLLNFSIPKWLPLYNAFEGYKNDRNTPRASLLYVLAENNLHGLIRLNVFGQSCFDIEHERYGLPIFAALATKSSEAVQALLEIYAESQNLEPWLHELCRQRSKAAVENTWDSEFTFSRRRGVLSYIAQHGDETIMSFYLHSMKDKQLPERTAEIESRDGLGRTPLWIAADKRSVAMVKLLVENGADTNAKDYGGRTPLSWAAENGNGAMAKVLVESGANVNVKDNDGRTPLSCAAQSGNGAMVNTLVKSGAVLDFKDKNGWTLLWLIAKNGDGVMVKLLTENGAEINSKDNSDRTPLSWAAKTGNGAMVKVLVESGADINSKDKNGRTPLSWAAENRDVAMAKKLVETGADVDSKDNGGRTPLSWAAENGDIVMAEVLVESGANADFKDNGGRTPLSWATGSRDEAMMKLLLDRGAQIETKDTGGRTPLSWASIVSWNDAIVRLLLKVGAGVEIKDNRGRTPLSWASGSGNKAIAKLLLDHGAQLESTDDSGRTPLSWASGSRDEAIVKLLLDRGAQIESRDGDGRTPLSWASSVQFWNDSIVRLFLELGAEIETKDNNGRTPLSWAASFDSTEDIVRLLLENGAESETEDSDGRTPMWWARNSERDGIRKLLRKRR